MVWDANCSNSIPSPTTLQAQRISSLTVLRVKASSESSLAGLRLPNSADIESVVAVHDLDEDLRGAWTDPHTGVLWLRDLLPDDALVARVLTFGYTGSPSSFFIDPLEEPVTPIARNLISYLRSDRANAQCEQRPIIFVCHGMGGIVVKKALMLSKGRTNYQIHYDHSIFTCTAAILFFGTPHAAIDPAVWLKSRRISIFSKYKLTRHTSALQTINEDFRDIEGLFCQLFFWAEIEPHVGHSSAVPYGPQGGTGIPTDHAGMVKFTTIDSPGYAVVRNDLQRFCRDARSRIKPRLRTSKKTLRVNWQERICLDYGPEMDKTMANQGSSSPEKPRNRIFLLPKHHHLDPAEFIGREKEKKLLDEAFFNPHSHQLEAKIFVVYGMGGTGKTELSSWFARHHKEE